MAKRLHHMLKVNSYLSARENQQFMLFLILSFVFPVIFAITKIGFKKGNLSVPLNMSYDEIFYANESYSFLKNLSLTNTTFGFPGKQDLGFAFISGDTLPIFLSSLIARFKNDAFFGLNVYFITSLGLIGLSFFLSSRLLGANNFLSFIFSIFVSISHHNLAWTTQAPTFGSYYLLPVFFSVMILKFKEKNNRPSILKKRTYWIIWQIFVISYGAFFSYFTLYTLLLIATLVFYLTLSNGNFAYLKICLKDIGLLISGFLLMAVPSFVRIFKTVGEVNYFKERNPAAAFVNSGTPFQTLFPTSDSFTWKIIDLLHLPWRESTEPVKNVMQSHGIFDGGWSETIDVFLVALFLLSIFIRNRLKTRKFDFDSDSNGQLNLLLILIISSIIWMWGGGLGTILASTIFPTLRQYSMFGIFLLVFLALYLSVSFTELFSQKKLQLTWKLKTGFFLCLSIALANTFTLDAFSTAGQNSIHRDEIIQFVDRIPANCNVLQFPIVHYPWEAPGNPGYKMLLPGLLTKRTDLKWSYGAVGGTTAWVKQSIFRMQQDQPSAQLLEDAKKLKFCAILIDRDAWNSFYSFKPSPSYKNSPAVSYEAFVTSFGGFQKFNFSNGNEFAFLILD